MFRLAPRDAEEGAEEGAEPLRDDDRPPERAAVHGDEHEGGVAARDEDVDGAVVRHAEEAAHVRQHEEAEDDDDDDDETTATSWRGARRAQTTESCFNGQ